MRTRRPTWRSGGADIQEGPRLVPQSMHAKRLPEPADLRRADENSVVRQLDDVHNGKAGRREVARLTQSLPEAPLRHRWCRPRPDRAWLAEIRHRTREASNRIDLAS
jgi:hypothetical protein